MVDDVAGVEEAVLVEDRAVLLEVGARDGGAAHLEPAEGLAVARQLVAVIVGDLHLDAERRMALLLLDVEPLLAASSSAYSGLSEPSVPSGLISVMPQAWQTSTP